MVLGKFMKNHVSLSAKRIENLVTSSRFAFSANRIEKAHYLASIKKAEDILGYKPSHNLDKGLSAAAEKLWNGTGRI